MPELPEVETVKNGLLELGLKGKKIEEIVFLSPGLRNEFPTEIPDLFREAKIKNLHRRAKYILFETDRGVLLSHLGMTGTWRKEPADFEKRKHDHIEIHFPRFVIVYNDPRRFGFFDSYESMQTDNPYLGHLGPEPLSEDFEHDYLWSKSRKRSASVKNFIMDQRIVVGVGNIYACEALFRTGVRPQKQAGKLSRNTYEILVGHIKDILNEAIASGGSTISDFKQAGGDSGYFQHDFKVYAREKEPCVVCGKAIKNEKLGGRSSFYCPSCQS